MFGFFKRPDKRIIKEWHGYGFDFVEYADGHATYNGQPCKVTRDLVKSYETGCPHKYSLLPHYTVTFDDGSSKDLPGFFACFAADYCDLINTRVSDDQCKMCKAFRCAQKFAEQTSGCDDEQLVTVES